jgi:drug/metabolite transporter (DMT)-like permease
MSAKRIQAYILLLLVTIIWAVASVVLKYTLDGISPLPFLTYRFLISAGIGVFGIITFKHKLPRKLSTWIAIAIYSFLSTTFSLGLLFLGLDLTTVLQLSLITLIGPLLVEVAGVIFLQEKITKREKIGTAIAFIGAIFTVLEPIFEAGASFGGIKGNLLIVSSMLSDIASIILLKKLITKDINSSILIHISFVIGLLTLLPVTIVFMGIPLFVQIVTELPIQYHLGVLYMAIMSGTVAYAMRAKAQRHVDIGEAGLFGYLSSTISAPLAVLFLHETITPLFIVGAVLIGIGVGVAEWRKKK